jgi:hypothetical protein
MSTGRKSPKRKEKKGKPHRIQKGERLPGAGRPLGSKDVKSAVEAISSLYYGEVQFPGGVKRKLTGLERVVDRIFKQALHGNLRGAEMLLDRKYGKTPLPIKNIGDGTGRVSINIVRNLKDANNPNVEIKEERTEPKEQE